MSSNKFISSMNQPMTIGFNLKNKQKKYIYLPDILEK